MWTRFRILHTELNIQDLSRHLSGFTGHLVTTIPTIPAMRGTSCTDNTERPHLKAHYVPLKWRTSGENDEWVTCTMSNMHRSMLWKSAKYFSYLSLARQGRREGVRVHNRLEQAGMLERDTGVDDVTAKSDRIPQWHFKCNTKARQRPLAGQLMENKGDLWVIIVRRQASITTQHRNNRNP